VPSVTHPTHVSAVNDRVPLLKQAQSHYPPSDEPLFTSAYNELCREDLNGRRVMEVCCGYGKLAACLAEAFPNAEITAVDRYEESGVHIKEVEGRFPKLRYHKGDATRLPEFADGTFDLIFGQATLHHLAHDIQQVAREYHRLLKPGGRLIFVFEPLGHNPLVAAIRAARFAKTEGGDESNLYFSQFAEIERTFASCEVQVFNLLGYPAKALRSDSVALIAKLIQAADDFLLAKKPSLLKYCANCNVIFQKAEGR